MGARGGWMKYVDISWGRFPPQAVKREQDGTTPGQRSAEKGWMNTGGIWGWVRTLHVWGWKDGWRSFVDGRVVSYSDEFAQVFVGVGSMDVVWTPGAVGHHGSHCVYGWTWCIYGWNLLHRWKLPATGRCGFGSEGKRNTSEEENGGKLTKL